MLGCVIVNKVIVLIKESLIFWEKKYVIVKTKDM